MESMMSINQITIDEIKKLSLPEKILIVEEIWDSIAEDDEYPELTEAQRIELNRRIDSYQADPSKGKTWEEIKNNYWKQKHI
jgi:putative addiction module component (TIGR02574 family)